MRRSEPTFDILIPSTIGFKRRCKYTAGITSVTQSLNRVQ